MIALSFYMNAIEPKEKTNKFFNLNFLFDKLKNVLI